MKGQFSRAIVYTDQIDQEAIRQITELCNQKFCRDSTICIMPDVHAGAGCTIGTTMTITDKVVPNLVGVDIGCGIEVIKLQEKIIDLKKLDNLIRTFVPSGFDIRKKEHPYVQQISLHNLKAQKHLDIKRARLSVGTLGGGNHFIEVNEGNNGVLYLTIHSGSRHLGKQLADYYQARAAEKLSKQLNNKVPRDLAYLEDQDFKDYIHDMKIVQHYATVNRQAIVDEIVRNMQFTVVDKFTTIHNYIDTKNMILRKGAISAQKGERVIIPINMRDGSILAIGKGNPAWNYSAPHGAGRILSRTQAKKQLSLKEFRESMRDIYSTSVRASTLDEAPMAYRPLNEILKNIQDTVEVVEVIKPIYNYKAG